jgi:hypothetical protein
MRESVTHQRRNDEQETEKAPFLVVKKIRDAILDETFKPGDWLPETELGERFGVSRSPVREALLPVFKTGTVIAMNRDARDPVTNTIINTVAGYLDLSQLYGSTPEVAASLRNADGTLMTSNNGTALPIVNDQFVSGDVRVMENPELTATTTLFMREHNFWVGTLQT